MSAIFLVCKFDSSKLKPQLNYFKQHAKAEYFEDETALHITLRKLRNDDSSIHDLTKLLDIYQQTYDCSPMKMYAKNFYKFDRNIYWIGLQDSFSLYIVKHQLEELAMKYDISLDKEDFSYTPHITLAFNAQVDSSFNTRFKPVPITVTSIQLLAYDHKIGNAHISSVMHEIIL